MTIFHFTIEVSGIDTEAPGFEDRFYGNGVDDASIRVSNGKLLLGFDRDAANREAAMESAVRDVRERGGKVVKIELDDFEPDQSAHH